MTAAILRIVISSLVICGIAGAMLYQMQFPRKRSELPAADRPSAGHVDFVRQRDLRNTELQIARSIADLPTYARRASIPPRSGAISVAQQLAAETTDDLDLNDPALRVPLARLALATVGADELADAIWLHAINDPSVSADDRKDLIEDLNEDGFVDSKHLVAADLPLIESRLALIERLAPDAIDKTNADAFAEARQDLLAMRAALVQGTAHEPTHEPSPAPEAAKPNP